MSFGSGQFELIQDGLLRPMTCQDGNSAKANSLPITMRAHCDFC